MNEQLKDLLKTYNLETKKLREDFELREQEMKAKVGDLSRALILQEKKLIERMIEGLDSKHQMYNADRFEFDVLAKMDDEFEDLKRKRQQPDSDFPKKLQAAGNPPAQPAPQLPQKPAPAPAPQSQSKPETKPVAPARQPSPPAKKAEEPQKPDPKKSAKPDQPMFPSFGKEKPKPEPVKQDEDFDDGRVA